MQILELQNLEPVARPGPASLLPPQRYPPSPARFTLSLSAVRIGLTVIALVLVAAGCAKDPGADAIQSDVNGYLCLKCGAKLYTDRSVFIGPKCPKCSEDQLMPVVGYYCEKDQHLTIRAARGDRRGAVCEKCQAALSNAMRSPKRKDLEPWGATKYTQ